MAKDLLVGGYGAGTLLVALERHDGTLVRSGPGPLSEVEKLVFFDDEKIVLVIPILPKTLDLASEGGGFRIECVMRAYALGRDTQAVWIDAHVDLDAMGAGQFTRFKVLQWTHQGGSFPTPFKRLSAGVFKRKIDDGPRFARALGLALYNTGHDVDVSLRFDRLIEFRMEVELANEENKVKPWGLRFDSDELETPNRKTKISVRQPRPDPAGADRPSEWPANHWIVQLEVPWGAAARFWNDHILAPYVRALHSVQDGRPVSLLPELPVNATHRWRAKFSFIDGRVEDPDLDVDDFDDCLPKAKPKSRSIAMIPRTLEPAGITSGVLTLKAFRTTDPKRSPLEIVASIAPPTTQARDDYETDLDRHNEGFFFEIAHTATIRQQIVRVGALDLVFVDKGTVAAGSVGVAKVSLRMAPDGSAVARVEELRLVLGAMDIRPGNQDPIPGEEFNESSLAFAEPEYDVAFRRAVPLVIDVVDRTAKPFGDAMVLTARESAIERESQTLTMSIASPSAPLGNIDVIVVDTNPLTVARVQVDAGAGNLAETTAIGNWSNRSADLAWEIASAADGFDLSLPPQGVGETMERRRGDFVRADDAGNEALLPADFRFSPNARLRLRSSFFKQRFVEVPWNLRRVLGYPGQRAAGAGVDSLAFELLYGLSARVENDGLRLAEIAARLGELPGRQEPVLPWRPTADQDTIYRLYRDAWRDHYRALLSRLGILEPYDLAHEGTLTLTDADGVGYELRAKAELADPIPGRPVSSPFIAGGLRGGWSWGFESANVLDAVLRAPRSSSALLARPFFSALGGWGYQKASFDRNRSTIYSDTSMGRTFSISIERIGRISVLWNRAKHVIVYERTVMPTRQFAGTQDLLLGVPVLRKVREYVEILQDERNYPEFGESPAGPGCIRGAFFPEGTRRINVDGAWGEDVGRIGWKVPLWRPDADPVVYPRPNVTAKVAGDHPDKVNPLTLSEPDKLYFFTNTEPDTTADTDSWPAVEGIDYPRLRKFENPKAAFGVGTPTPAKDRPQPPEVMIGTSRFTFALDPTPHAADVVYGRTDAVIGAVLRNVTMARGPLSEAAGATLAQVTDFSDEATRAIAAVATGGTVAEVQQKALAELAKVKIELDRLLPSLPTKEAVCKQLQEALLREFDRATTAGAGAVPAIDQILATTRALHSSIDASLDRLKVSGQTVAQARAELHAERVRLFEEGRRAIRGMRTHVGALEAAVARTRDLLAIVASEVGGHFARLLALLDGAAAWTDDLRNEVKTQAEALRGVLDPVERAVEDSSRVLTGAVPDQARVLVRKAVASLRAITDRALAVASAAQTVAPAALKAELTSAAVAIEAALVDVDDELAALQADIASDFAATPVERELVTLNGKVEKIIDDAANAAAEWNDLIAAVEAELAALVKRLDQVIKDQIIELRDFVDARAALVCKHLPDLPTLSRELADVIAKVDRLIADALAGITPNPADVERLVRQIGGDVRRAVEEVAQAAGVTLGDVATSGERVFRLVRAFGEVPRVPGLGFDVDRIAYHFVDVAKNLVLPDVSLSPVIAHAGLLLEGAAQALKPLGTGLPSVKLLDRVVPFELERFDLSKVFPDFAGLKLDGLFSNIRMPQIANDNVRVTHGFDQQAMRGWVQVDADVPFDEPITVVSILGITLTLVSGRFRATSRIVAEAGRPPQQTFTGDISGEWRLQVGGFDLVAFVDTHLRFDDRGTLRFELSPDRIKLQAVLQFVSELMASFGYSDSGFSIRILPTGVRSTLNLPLPDIQGGTFGLANLVLGSEFALELVSNGADQDFVISTRFFVGKKTAPFTITVFILGGAGWVDARLRYVPARNEFQTEVSVGITAAASLAISLGPIKGGIYAYFGITVEYSSSSTGRSDLRIGLLLLFRGEVTLLGFVSVGLCLALEAQYTSGGGLIGRGRVSYSIKICWCVTINVSTEVSYRFGAAGGGAQQPMMAPAAAGGPSPYQTAAAQYVDMFA